MKRLLYLDNLKVCLTVLVIFHHAAIASFGLTWLLRMIPGVKKVL